MQMREYLRDSSEVDYRTSTYSVGMPYLGLGHFILDPKTRTGTDPKIPDLEPDRKFTSTFWVSIFFTRKNRNRKKPTQIDPDPKRTDPNRPDPIRTDLYPT